MFQTCKCLSSSNFTKRFLSFALKTSCISLIFWIEYVSLLPYNMKILTMWCFDVNQFLKFKALQSQFHGFPERETSLRFSWFSKISSGSHLKLLLDKYKWVRFGGSLASLRNSNLLFSKLNPEILSSMRKVG